MNVMIQESIPICPKCRGAVRKILNEDIWYVCVDSHCKTLMKVVGAGQSQRELECEVIKND